MTKIRTGQAGTRCMRAAIVALAAATSLAFGAQAWAVPMTYTLAWDDVDGEYGGVPFTGKTMTLVFSADTDNIDDSYSDNGVGQCAVSCRALQFVNGQGVTVAVSDVLAASPLDANQINTLALTVPDATTGDTGIARVRGIRKGFSSFGARHDLMYLDLTHPTAGSDWLRTEWVQTSTEGNPNTNNQFGNTSLYDGMIVDGKTLRVTKLILGNASAPYVNGRWNSAINAGSTAATTTEWLLVDPDPVTSGSTYTVSGTVTVDNQNDAPASGNLPGSVTVSSTDSELATCVDTDLTPSSSGTGVYDFACDILAGEPGEYSLDVRYADTSDPKVYSDSDDLSRASVLVVEPPPPPPVSCDGFFAPVDRAPTVNKANAGRVIPLKWRCTVDGMPADTYENFSVTSHVCDDDEASVAAADAIEEYAPGGSGLMYHGDGYWQFNWATPKSYRNSCRTVTVGFDGETLDATFRFVR